MLILTETSRITLDIGRESVGAGEGLGNHEVPRRLPVLALVPRRWLHEREIEPRQREKIDEHVQGKQSH